MTETRAEKAQRLVDAGAVDTIHHHWHAISAWVRGDHDCYRVVLYPSGNFFCACNWGAFHSHTDDLCAHALALRLAVERGAG